MRAIAAVTTSALRDNDPKLDAEPDAADLLWLARTLGLAGALCMLPPIPSGEELDAFLNML